jgi:hypothetical protein
MFGKIAGGTPALQKRFNSLAPPIEVDLFPSNDKTTTSKQAPGKRLAYTA